MVTVHPIPPRALDAAVYKELLMWCVCSERVVLEIGLKPLDCSAYYVEQGAVEAAAHLFY